MADRRGADLSISIAVGTTGTVSTLRLANEPTPLRTYGELRQVALDEHRAALEDDLGRMKRLLGEHLDQADNWADLEQAFAILRKRSNLLFRDLFGRRQVLEVQKLLTQAFNTARASGRFAFVEVISADFDTAPLEFLRVYHEPRSANIADEESLLQIASEFMGFTAIIKRNISGISLLDENAAILENDPRLPVKFFWDSTLGGAQSEWKFFKEHSAAFDIDGPWPDRELTNEEANRVISGHLWNPGLKFDGSLRSYPDQIQHFACHFYVEQKSEDSFFRLGFGESSARATLGDIDSQLVEFRTMSPRLQTARLPLVFANACASSAVRPSSLTSLPAIVLRNENIGYIGAETRIPDEAAHEFSHEFYRQILKKERLGDAVTKARLYLITRYHNPLGILYTLYADPDIQVRRRYEISGDDDDSKR